MHRFVLRAVCCFVLSGGFLAAQAREPASLSQPLPLAAVASPEQDDATLRDVALGDHGFGLAVGDRGVVWMTRDGGRTWEFSHSGVEASLRSVSLLDDQIAWIAGWEIAPATRVASGVVLQTHDGGRTWRRIDSGALPSLRSIQFFDQLRGCAVGDPTPQSPAGVYSTEDGGNVWDPAPGVSAAGWNAAAFIDFRNGVAVGPRNQQGVIGNGKLLPMRSAPSLRGLHDVALQSHGRGWLVGDGAEIRTTANGGVSWPEPPSLPPAELRDLQDFHAVAAVRESVWIGGAPGSVVWHSSDAGHTWAPQATGDAAPIHGIAFANESHGVAVGAFGKIVRTSDSGRTWQPVRGAARRPALLTLMAAEADLPVQLLVRESGENGYRSVALVAARRDVGADAATHQQSRDQLLAALLAAHGNDCAINWRLPVNLPDLTRDREMLLAEWSRLTEQRLQQTLLGGLVQQLRMWRPETLVIDEPQPDDALGKLIHDAALLAVQQAAESTRYPEHQALLGLAPWQVSKVFSRLPGGEAPLRIDPHQPLPRLEATVQLRATEAASRLPGCDAGQAESFRLAATSPELSSAAGEALWNDPLARSFFVGLTIGPDARRTLPSLNAGDFEQLAHLARHQRNFEAATAPLLDDPQRAGQILAQLRETAAPLPRDQAARLLADLAEEHRNRSQWELVERTLAELVAQYPEQPPAKEAMRWLLAQWTSQEMLWQQLRQLSAGSPQMSLDRQILQANFADANEAARTAENAAQIDLAVGELSSPLDTTTQRGGLQIGGIDSVLRNGQANLSGGGVRSGSDQVSVEVARRRQQARGLLDRIRQMEPALYVQPEVQFLCAALLRQQQQAAPAAEIYRSFFGLEESATPWNLTARGELWIAARGALSPKPVLRCARASKPPILDGVLSDGCWQSATEVRLTRSAGNPRSQDPTFVGSNRLEDGAPSFRIAPADAEADAIVMLSYDERFLYLAASVPRDPEVRKDPHQQAGRTYDADLSTFDRLMLTLDVDRDYATWYRFDIDQRGWTRDAVWNDQRWNPKWHVAADSESRVWRIEAAIPMEELVPVPPTRGTVWAGSVTRITPGRELQSWTDSASLTPQPQSFGLIQFD